MGFQPGWDPTILAAGWRYATSRQALASLPIEGGQLIFSKISIKFPGRHAPHASDASLSSFIFQESKMSSRVQQLAANQGLSFNEFIGEMRKRGCCEATASKIWEGHHERFEAFNDNDIYLSNLRKAADVLKVKTGRLLDD
jgi:hypothetical protein